MHFHDAYKYYIIIIYILMDDGAKDTNNHVFGAQATNLNLLTITAEICI